MTGQQMTLDFDKYTCEHCQHAGMTTELCFMNMDEEGDFLQINSEMHCDKFYSLDMPRYDSLTQPKE